MGKRGKEVVHLCHQGSNEPDGSNAPYYDDVISFTVVNDQGFLLTKHRLYMSSKPFEDPRILPGGPGIAYTVDDGMGNKVSDTLDPRFPGWAWGMVYMTKQGLKHSTQQFKANWQDLPDSVPEVKGYTGWDHMRCDMDAGAITDERIMYRSRSDVRCAGNRMPGERTADTGCLPVR